MLIRKNIIILVALQWIVLAGCAQDKNRVKGNSGTKKTDSLNRLADAKSPYLQQHANNPVDWYEWGDEALQKAKEENKPLIISIGYSACHWCHVMEHESFMDSAVAKIMNENFVSIKIDREERPDIDQIYMDAVMLLTGRGGWPLNAFALPDGRPFYAGTYFPKDEWIKLLIQIDDIYTNKKQEVEQQASQLTEGIKAQELITVEGDSAAKLSQATYKEVFKNWQEIIDFKKGGFNKDMKFPLPPAWEFLLQYHYLTESEKALEAVTATLNEMAQGGIYDQVGGGFARYSTDPDWFAPHFEKMLYDNGQLVSLYARAYKVTQNENYARIIRETLEFVKREMTDSEGGFYSSLNADSEGEEGKFYVWTKEEIEETLDEQTAQLIIDFYNVKKLGNWEEGNNILFHDQNHSKFAQKNGLSEESWYKVLEEAKSKLLEKRGERIRPSTDDKVLTSWNALMMKGYIDAYLALGNEEYLEIALRSAHFLEENMMRESGRLWRNYKDGEAGIEAFLDDYSLLADAYIHLYQTTFDVHWLNLAKKVTDYAVAHFRDEQSGMFYYTSDEAENLIARKMEINDNVMPGSNSVMASVLYKMGEYYYHEPYIQMSKTMLSQVKEKISEGGPYYANWASVLGLVTFEPYEIAIMGENAVDKNIKMQEHYLPTALFMGGEEENLPLLENKLNQKTTMIYVCRNKTCKFPVQEIEEALSQME